MARWLKQSTAVTVVVGPFVDSTDGFTSEVALTITQADARLSKNGAAFAQKGDATSLTHMELGHYSCPLSTTDTGTLGTLRLAVSEAGALPVWEDFLVVPANVWDSFFGADALQVHAIELSAALITAASIAADAITDAKVASDVTIASVTGNVGGNVVGSVASVTAGVTVASLGTDALTAAAVSAGAANKMADHTLRRTYAGARASAFGDGLNFRSLLGAMGKLVNKWSISGTTLTIFQEDDATSTAPGGTQTLTPTAGADPITALDTV